MMKFEHQWGGEDTWYTKSKRWANNQRYPWNQIYLGIIDWLHKHWVNGKIEMEMDSVDQQSKSIVQQWEEQENVTRTTTVEERPSSVPNLPTLIIRNEVVERGSDESSAGMASPSTPIQIPDPWDYSGDWNDALIGFHNESRRTTKNVGEGQSN